MSEPDRPQAGGPSEGSTRRDVLAWTAGSVVGGSLLAACGGTSQTTASSTKSATSATAAASTGSVKPGGALVVGVDGGGSGDTLDPALAVANTDIARVFNLYDSLCARDPDFVMQMLLAESIEPGSKGAAWTVRLRRGVEFHNGKTLTADDVLYTWKRILNPHFANNAASDLAAIDLASTKKLDPYTLRVALKVPDVEFTENLVGTFSRIVPEGFDPKHPVGTGPFMFKSFSPGQQSVFVRNPNYWRTGRPYLDQLTIVDLGSDSARVNALISGQVDCIANLPPSQVAAVQANPSLRTLIAQTGNIQPMTMRVDKPPFTDARVRQAFRLIADREQLLQQALDGQGRVANDMYSPYDLYPSFPQRVQDLEQAKFLLKAAGQSDLSVQFTTSPTYEGMVQAATVFAQQAAGAGVKVQIRNLDPGSFFGPQFLKYTFSQDYWFTVQFIKQSDLISMPYSSFNETHWNNPQFTALVMQARAELDTSKRADLIRAAQRILYDEGGLIIWGFSNQIDGYSAKILGLRPSKFGMPLGNWGFGDVGFKA